MTVRPVLQRLRRVSVSGRGKRPRLPLLLPLALSAALAGCSVGPEYKRPDTPAPTTWREGTASATAAWPSADWWRNFGSSELDGYIAQARQTNYDLAAAIARVREADALVTEAGAALLPAVNFSASAERERSQSTTGVPSTRTIYSPQLSASYVLDFWGRNRAAQTAAVASATASRHDQATVELTVVTSVATTYFQSIELRDRLAVATSNLANAETILKGLRAQLDAGVLTALDVAQQETTVASLNAAIPPLRQQLRQSVNALAILTGQLPENLDATTATLADLSIPVVQAGLPAELLARRPDVAEAEDQLVAANANIRVARAAFFPNIELTAAGGFASFALSNVLKSTNFIYSLAAGLAQPIFDGGARKGQYAYAQARYDELVANYRKTAISAFGNVENALDAVQQTSEQEQRQAATVTSARRAHDIAQAQLRAGTVNILTVLNTETALYTAQDALVQSKFAHMQALVGLYSALGGGWQKEQGT